MTTESVIRAALTQALGLNREILDHLLFGNHTEAQRLVREQSVILHRAISEVGV